MNDIDETTQWRGKGISVKDLNQKNIAAGVVAAIFIITGPSALILEASSNGNFTIEQTILWIFSVYVFGGLFGIILPLYYRVPIVGGHTITGVAFLATVTAHFTYHELIGAYIVSGLFMLMVGWSGVFSKLIEIVPKEVISAMLAGMIVKYMVNFILSVHQLLLVGVASLLVFFLFSRWRTKIPPMIAAIFVGFIVLILTTPLHTGSGFASEAFLPQLQVPDFNLVSFLSVSIPLALLILSNDAAVAVGALEQNRYKAPINRIVSWGGIFSSITSFFGGQSANIAGMGTAICSSEEAGPKQRRYMGAAVAGAVLLVFGLFAWKLVPLIYLLPVEFISIIVGFSLIGVFANSLHHGFSNPAMKVSVAFAFFIAMSDITVTHISAPVWSLIIGTLVARWVENGGERKSKKKGHRTA